MSRAEKLFEKLMSGQNDANIPFDELCTFLIKFGYTARTTKGSHIIFQRGSSFLKSAAEYQQKGEGLSSAPGAGTVAKIGSQTMMKHTDAT